MKKICYIIIVLTLVSCGASDSCFKSTGAVTSKTVDVSQTPFTKISVFPGIGLVVKEGPDYEVTVQSGANIIDDVALRIENGMLTLKDDSGCNLVRSYGQTKVFITAPNIEEIYSNTEKDVVSDGVLHYPILRLFSMDFFGGVGTGDFHIEVDNAQVVVEANHVAGYYLKGHTGQFLANFYDGVGRLEAAELIAEDVQVFHRGSNDMIVHPVQNLSGNIYGTGNLISKSQPTTVDIVEHWSGRLIFD